MFSHDYVIAFFLESRNKGITEPLLSDRTAFNADPVFMARFLSLSVVGHTKHMEK